MPEQVWSASRYKLADSCLRRFAWTYLYGNKQASGPGPVLGKDAHWVWEQWLMTAAPPRVHAVLAAEERMQAACGKKLARDGEDDTYEGSIRLMLNCRPIRDAKAKSAWIARVKKMSSEELQG